MAKSAADLARWMMTRYVAPLALVAGVLAGGLALAPAPQQLLPLAWCQADPEDVDRWVWSTQVVGTDVPVDFATIEFYPSESLCYFEVRPINVEGHRGLKFVRSESDNPRRTPGYDCGNGARIPDYNFDGKVGGPDFAVFRQSYASCGLRSDINGDGDGCSDRDFAMFRLHFQWPRLHSMPSAINTIPKDCGGPGGA